MHRRQSTLWALLVQLFANLIERARHPKLHIRRSKIITLFKLGCDLSGLSCLTIAAGLVSIPLGFATAGISFFILSWHIGQSGGVDA